MVNGKFEKGDNIIIADENNNKLVRGLASFPSEEIVKIKGRQSNEEMKYLAMLVKQKLFIKMIW